MTAVLGPAPCRDCGTPLTWTGREWVVDGRSHRCTRPLCMTEQEWAAWQAANEVTMARSMKAVSPCSDCTIAFAMTQRAIHRCNGTPGMLRRPKAQPLDHAAERRRARWREAQKRRRERLAAA